MIPSGALVTISDDSCDDPRFVNVICEEKTVGMFVNDLLIRATLVGMPEKRHTPGKPN